MEARITPADYRHFADERIKAIHRVAKQEGEAESMLSPLVVVDAGDLLNTEPPSVDTIIPGLFDAGDKVALIGPSKTWKSFFLIQMLLSLAAGICFLTWKIPKPRRVLLVQSEIQGGHNHRRVKMIAAALGITRADIGDRLQIANIRGLGVTGTSGVARIQKTVEALGSEFVVIDPLYKLAEGDENLSKDQKPLLQCFDSLTLETGAALGYAHHDAKGNVGDRSSIDRGSGSNILTRDYDGGVILTPQSGAGNSTPIFAERFDIRFLVATYEANRI